LRETRTGNEGMVDQNNGSWNQLSAWLSRVAALRQAA
jgi:hypothetical protein